MFCTVDGEPLPAAVNEARPSSDQDDPRIGRVLDGKYRLERKLGEGGMGAVYLASHTKFEKKLAVKLLHQDPTKDPTLGVRFRREANAAARIDHPNVVQVSDFGETADGHLYMVMELVKGDSLRQLLTTEPRFTPERVTHLLRQICAALYVAHRAGVVHRDLKPENIMVEMLDGQERVRVLDFGIAKLKDESSGLTAMGQIVGTPFYMSPEQWRGEAVDHRADVYSLGAMLYEMLSGQVPLRADTLPALMYKHLYEIPPPLTAICAVSESLCEVVMRALEKSPASRQQSVLDLADQLLQSVASSNRPTLQETLIDVTEVADPANVEVFVAFASQDATRASQIAGELKKSGIKVWFDEGKRVDHPAAQEAVRAIKHCKVMMLCCTEAAMQARDMRQEILLGWKYAKPYLPLKLEPIVYSEQLEYWLEGWPFVDVGAQPVARWMPQVRDALRRAGVTAPPVPLTYDHQPRFRGLGAAPRPSNSRADEQTPQVIYPQRGLQGLRAISRFTNNIWPVAADKQPRGTRQPVFRGMGARPQVAQHQHRLGSRVRLAIDSDREGYLLLLDEGPEKLIYCLCPSQFAPDTHLPKGLTVLPQAGANYDAFVMTGEPGKEQLLAIITDTPLDLDWMSLDASAPARILSEADIEALLTKLRGLDESRWTALATYFDVVA